MTARIGVVADTHSPGMLERLPERLLEELRGVDLILHAGDIDGASTLDTLGRIAPVKAARGDHDQGIPDLPEVLEVTVDGKKIVVVHGNRTRWIEEPVTLLWTLTLGHYHPHGRLPKLLRRRFPDADVVVFGHTHRPLVDSRQRPLVLNPGGVHQWTPQTTAARLQKHPGWFEWCWLQVARFIRSYPSPTAAILELDGERIEPRIVPL